VWDTGVVQEDLVEAFGFVCLRGCLVLGSRILLVNVGDIESDRKVCQILDLLKLAL